MWLVTVKGLAKPVIRGHLLGIEPGLPILINGKLYEIVSYKRYDE
jgi:hypothetical protein